MIEVLTLKADYKKYKIKESLILSNTSITQVRAHKNVKLALDTLKDEAKVLESHDVSLLKAEDNISLQEPDRKENFSQWSLLL